MRVPKFSSDYSVKIRHWDCCTHDLGRIKIPLLVDEILGVGPVTVTRDYID